MPELIIRDLAVSYGGVRAVRGVDLSVRSGELVALVGANGAGKSSTARAIMGLTPATGSVTVAGREMLGRGIRKRRANGLAFVPEGRGIFASMTVRDNLLMGGYGLKRRARDVRLDAVSRTFPILGERFDEVASSLSGGEQQMLALARALMADPAVLLCDEPSMGLAPAVIQTLFRLIRGIADQGAAVLVADENANRAMEIADVVNIMRLGLIVASGTPASLGGVDGISQHYFGTL